MYFPFSRLPYAVRGLLKLQEIRPTAVEALLAPMTASLIADPPIRKTAPLWGPLSNLFTQT